MSKRNKDKENKDLVNELIQKENELQKRQISRSSLPAAIELEVTRSQLEQAIWN